jgi:hypothetical protein
MFRDPAEAVDTFEEHARLLRPKPRHAQILLELDEDDGKTLNNALGVLKRAGVEPFRFEPLQGDVPVRVLIELSSRDMREAVLRLSEAGFYKVMGINAAHARPGAGQGG